MKKTCVTTLVFGLCLSVPFFAQAAPPMSRVIDKPGLFKLDQSTDNSICRPLEKMINADIQKFGKTQLEKRKEFVKWRLVDERRIDRGNEQKYGESVELAEVDLNNDGALEDVVRTKWSLRGDLMDALNILPRNEGQKIAVGELLKSDKLIMFNNNHYWLNRHIKKYGVDNSDWYFDGVASLDLLRMKEKTYVVAQHYAAPKNVSAKIFVFRLDPTNEVVDVCMFVKVCPCGGCEDLSGDEVVKTLPGKKWCRENIGAAS
jgi:hypothetical protein